MSDDTKRTLKYAAIGVMALGAIGLIAGGHVGIAAAGTAVAGTYVLTLTFATIGGLGGALIAKST